MVDAVVKRCHDVMPAVHDLYEGTMMTTYVHHVLYAIRDVRDVLCCMCGEAELVALWLHICQNHHLHGDRPSCLCTCKQSAVIVSHMCTTIRAAL